MILKLPKLERGGEIAFTFCLASKVVRMTAKKTSRESTHRKDRDEQGTDDQLDRMLSAGEAGADHRGQAGQFWSMGMICTS